MPPLAVLNSVQSNIVKHKDTVEISINLTTLPLTVYKYEYYEITLIHAYNGSKG
jgi:hypothetical protein